MKKRLLCILFLFIISLCLVSCRSDNKKKKAEQYEHIVLEGKEEDLLASISEVEDSVGYLKIKKGVNSYITNTAFIYKYDELKGCYYALSTYIDNMENSSITMYLEKYGEFSAVMLGFDAFNDLACFKIVTDEKITPINLKGESNVEVGTEVFTLATKIETLSSNAKSNDYNTLFTGVIGHFDGRLIKHSALAHSSYLGSPLFDYEGNVIGINTDRTVDEEKTYFAFNFAVSTNSLLSIANELEELHKTGIKRFNFTVKNVLEIVYIEGAKEQMMTLPDGIKYGIYINEDIAFLSPLYGIFKKGDIITSVNGKALTNTTDLVNAVCLSHDDDIEFVYYRKYGTSFDKKSYRAG